jgi:hypothetical protein
MSFFGVGSVVTILVPDNIPIWGDIQNLSEYHADLGLYLENINDTLGFQRIFFWISPRFSGNRRKVSVS